MLKGSTTMQGTMMNVNNIPNTPLQSSYPTGLAAATASAAPTIMDGVKAAGFGTGIAVASGTIVGKTIVNVVGQEAANQLVVATVSSASSLTGGYVAAVEATANMAFLAGNAIPFLP
jgi:hypothetical protein